MPQPPSWIEKVVSQTVAYEDESALTQTSATTAAASRTAALPVSVRRKLRSGVSRFRAQAVRPENADAGGPVVRLPSTAAMRRLFRRAVSARPAARSRPAQARGVRDRPDRRR